MKILFLITTKGHGRGGHFHSLDHISSAIGKETEVIICSYGPGNSEVLKRNNHYYKHFFFNGINALNFRKEFTKTIEFFQPDIIHCFDVTAYLTFTSLFNENKYNIVLNKCGGPNPPRFPKIANLVLFSKENKEWFERNPAFNKSDIRLISNRINPDSLVFKNDKYDIAKKEGFYFVKIARIGSTYKESIVQCIELISSLMRLNNNYNIHLYIIGNIQEDSVYKDIFQKAKDLPITFLTKDKYTQKASEMLYLADAVIATGRGIMEATALGIPILTTASNSELPILVNKSNFKGFFNTNFSPRNIANTRDLSQNVRQISKMIENETYYSELKMESQVFFNEFFNIKTAVSKYLDFYKKILNQNEKKNSFNNNLGFKSRSFLMFIIENLKSK